MDSTALVSRQQMVEDNLGLVRLCAHRLGGRGVEYDDLYQAGCIGLLKAVDAFDVGRGVKFSTYAVPVIMGEIRRLFRDGGSVKVSRSIKELSLKISRFREEYLSQHQVEPPISVLCQEMGESKEKIVLALDVSQPVISLTAEEEGGGQFDLPVESHEEKVNNLLSLRAVIGHLEERDQKIIYYRYFKNQTQTQTAKMLSMTQVQVSRREKKILEKLRDRMLE